MRIDGGSIERIVRAVVAAADAVVKSMAVAEERWLLNWLV